MNPNVERPNAETLKSGKAEISAFQRFSFFRRRRFRFEFSGFSFSPVVSGFGFRLFVS
jgi:hypothetical protein